MQNRLEIDYGILLAVGLIFVLGILSLYSSTNVSGGVFKADIVIKQIFWFCLGILFLVFMMNFNYRRFQDLGWILYIISTLLLILVLLIAQPRQGAQRWLQILGVNFQPSELAKLAVILVLAKHLSKRRAYRTYNPDIWGFIPEVFSEVILPISLVGLPVFLIFKQPHLGAALSFLPILFFMLFFAGVNIRYIGLLVATGIITLPFFWHFLKEYQKARLLVFLNPDLDPLGAGYTIMQSKIAIGSGGLFGKGWLAGTQNQLNFLPERHTDFIFSVVGEEWGFLGASLLIILYCFIIMRSIKICSSTNDKFAQLIMVGIIGLLSFQVCLNIAMSLGVMPVVGITLPIMSYGGSSIIMTFIFLGIILNVSKKRIVF